MRRSRLRACGLAVAIEGDEYPSDVNSGLGGGLLFAPDIGHLRGFGTLGETFDHSLVVREFLARARDRLDPLGERSEERRVGKECRL